MTKQLSLDMNYGINIFKRNEISSIEDVQAMLEEAVLAGYNLRKEDFEED